MTQSPPNRAVSEKTTWSVAFFEDIHPGNLIIEMQTAYICASNKDNMNRFEIAGLKHRIALVALAAR